MVILCVKEEMRRYWLDESSRQGELVDIEGEMFHHIIHVCRQDLGSKFEVIFGDGKAYLVEVIEQGKKKAVAKIIEERVMPKLKEPWIHLVLSMPKASKFEFILEKSVELGVSQVHPVISDFSFYKTKNHKALEKRERWLKIIQAATQQSARADKMQLSEVLEIEQVLEKFNQNTDAMGLFAYEGEASFVWKEALQGLKSSRKKEIWIFVGSEGGFSNQEVELFSKFGLKAMTMGKQVLRVETACVALVSSIKYEFEL